MPHRITGIVWLLLGLVGIVLLGMLILVDIDAASAARTGPRWKRRLIAAALALLAAVGVTGRAATADSAGGAQGQAATQPAAPTQIQDTEQWKRLCDAWAAGEKIRATARGSYPFDEKGQKEILLSLDQAGKDIAALQKAGMLSDAEAGLLTGDLAVLRQAVEWRRATEERMATCYEPMMFLPVRDSWQRLKDRQALLKQLAAAKKLDAAVAEKVLKIVEEDTQVLQDEKGFTQIQDKPENVRKLRQEAEDSVKAIRSHLPAAATQPAAK